MEAKSFSLKSLGWQPESESSPSSPEEALLERMELQRFCAYLSNDPKGLLNTDKANERWLLEPFGYEAGIKRLSGQRFVTSLETGLEIVGQVITSEEGIKIHAGTTQVRVLLKVMEMLSPPKEKEGMESVEVDSSMEQQPEEKETTATDAPEPDPSSSLLVVLPVPASS